MAYRIMERGRDMMGERGGESEKVIKKIDEIHEMLDELSECIEESMEDEMGERGGYGERGRWEARGYMGERRRR